jgi:hypothetical protein
MGINQEERYKVGRQSMSDGALAHQDEIENKEAH